MNRNFRPALQVMGAIVLIVELGCGKAAPSSTPQVSYYKDTKALFDEKCVGCHVAGGIGPFDLSTYESVKAEGNLILPNIQAKVMPPWMPSDDSPAMEGDRRLTDAQIETISNWIKQGMPEGNPADAPRQQTQNNTFHADATFQIPQAYTPNTSLGTDDYHCFVMDPHLTADTAVTAFNVIPGDRRIVHHVLVFAVDPADLSSLQNLEAGGDGQGYTCFGGPGVNAKLIGGWVPGAMATTLPAGTGIIAKAGSQIVMQVHYNLLNAPNPAMPPPDQTSAQFAYTGKNSVTQAQFLPVSNMSFNVPVGQVKTVTSTFDTSTAGLPAGLPVYVYGVTPHMHLHGTDINLKVTHADHSEDLLVDIPKWQFQWQEMYFFQNYYTAHVGDSVTLSCTFDNTQAHQPYINGVQETAVPLQWGEDTLSEMCLGFIYVALSPPMQ